MKIAKRLLTLALAFSTLFAVGCGGKDKTKAKETITEKAEHFYEGGLHKVNVTPNSNRTFVQEGRTNYVLVVPVDDAAAMEAAVFIREQVRQATGASMNFVYDDGSMGYDANSKQIIIGDANLFEKAGLTMPTDDIGPTGFYLTTKDDNVFIAAKYRDGLQHGTLSFLREVLGFDQFRDGFITYSKDGTTIPDMSIIERPDFDYYSAGSKTTNAQRYGMGFTDGHFLVFNNVTWHNSLDYLPIKDHPEKENIWYNAGKKNELCYTARGNTEELLEMATLVAAQMFEELEKQPNVRYAAITVEDHADAQCSCEACTEVATTYGERYSAAIIRFTNFVNRELQALLQADATEKGTEKRDVKVAFFAYHYTEAPPVELKSDGKFYPMYYGEDDYETVHKDYVVCDDEVAVYLAPINAKYNQDFYHEENVSAYNSITGWGASTKNLLMWTYTTNFNNYLYPFNSFDSLMEMFRLCKNSNAIYYFNQGQYTQALTTGFNVIKDYIGSKGLYNVNLQYSDIVDQFFDQYFQVAKEPMRQMYEEIISHWRYLEKEKNANGWIYFDVNNPDFWPVQLLSHWTDLIEEAFALIEPLKVRQPELYEKLKINIRAEKIFVDFAFLDLHSGKFSKQELQARRVQFKKDCDELNFINQGEGMKLMDLFSNWGL